MLKNLNQSNEKLHLIDLEFKLVFQKMEINWNVTNAECQKEMPTLIYQNILKKKQLKKEQRDIKETIITNEEDLEGYTFIEIWRESEENLSRIDLDEAKETVKELKKICSNGLYNLETGEFKDLRPEDLITMQSYVNYEPEASTELAMKILKDIYDKDVDYVLELFAKTFDGIPRDDLLILHEGTTSNGKSFVTEKVLHIFGGYAKASMFDDILTEELSNNVEWFYKARLVLMYIVTDEKVIKKDLIKQLDDLTWRGKDIQELIQSMCISIINLSLMYEFVGTPKLPYHKEYNSYYEEEQEITQGLQVLLLRKNIYENSINNYDDDGF
ncbi:hypothetical protein DFJ73DRAFT_758537 [Zopfochytrium polystomum]|nr:hypothetical protein DFJ73DRAFT_758537 [Zopfochytrium polystomum]